MTMNENDDEQPIECQRCGDGNPDHWATLGDPDDPIVKRYVCEDCKDELQEVFSDG